MMRHSRKIRTILFIAISAITSVFISAKNAGKETVALVTAYYGRYLDSLRTTTTTFQAAASTMNEQEARVLFEKSRCYYKHIEFLVEYKYPVSAQKLNGPPLPESEISEPLETELPSGFQVLETYVYEDLTPESRNNISFELSTINTRLNRLKSFMPELELSESNILDALKLNLYRMITKGISGFDASISLRGIYEARHTLHSAREVMFCFSGSNVVVKTIDSALRFIETKGYDFNAFDRATFIADDINPVCRSLYTFQVGHTIPFVKEPRAVAVNAKTLFDKDAFDLMFYAPSGASVAGKEEIALGKRLFKEPLLSANGLRSCTTCHRADKTLTDGLKVNETLSGNKKLMRNTPSLLNAGLQPVQFYDSRIAYLEDQAHDVIANRQEMGGTFDDIVDRLGKEKDYTRLFQLVYKDKKITEHHIKSALAAYVRSLTSLNSPFDQYMRGDKKAMTTQQLNGFNVFMGKGKCGTCHFMPLFTGTVPPLYDKMESEVLGVPAGKDTLHALMDTDSGKYLLYNIPHQLFSFKTTTVRNIALTAPYMHNGVYDSLEEVIDFYDRGGGTGLGFALPNQTLPSDRVKLTAQEKKDIIAFLGALTDVTVMKNN